MACGRGCENVIETPALFVSSMSGCVVERISDGVIICRGERVSICEGGILHELVKFFALPWAKTR